MSRLTEEKCVACRADAPVVTEEEVHELKPQTPEWGMIEEDGIPKLDRLFKFENFTQALAFTAAGGRHRRGGGPPPEDRDRMGPGSASPGGPHKIRNLHRNDFIMAAKTDRVFGEAG